MKTNVDLPHFIIGLVAEQFSRWGRSWTWLPSYPAADPFQQHACLHFCTV